VTALWTSGGELLKQHRSTLGAPPKRGMSIGAFAFVPDDASAATLTCEPFTRDDAFPDPEPPADPSVSNIMTSSRIVTVPAVVGLTSDQARAEIAGSGLNVGRIAYDAAEPDAVFGTIGGRVVEQDPAAGTKVPAGTAVDLVLRPSGGVPWACPSPERIDFPAPSGGRVLPAGSAYIRGNLTGILRSDDIERMTVDPNGATDSNGVWRIVREGAVVAVVYPKLDGTACSGSGIEGT
jgi:hypothetical protein